MKNLVLLFAIVLAVSGDSFPRVRIFNPQKGDTWFTGDTRSIIWKKAYIPPPPDPPNLNITLHRVNSSFTLHLVTDYDTNKGSYSWNIPGWLPNGDDYQLYLIPNRADPRPGTPNIMASRSKPFTIVSTFGAGNEIVIRAPVAGEIWYGGQYRYIRWSTPGLAPGAKISIFIQDIKNHYVGYPYPYVIATDVDSSSNGVMGYRWQVPYDFRSSDGYQLTLIAQYGDGRDPVVAILPYTFQIVQVGDAGRLVPTPTIAIM